MSKFTRRSFIQTAGALTVGSLASRASRAADGISGIRVAVVGVNGRGRSHIGGFRKQLVAICDCDEQVLEREASSFEKNNGRKLEKFKDFRRLLERDDIDAISVATPNHTHSLISILAIQAGKDVYCEKPVSQTLWEGRQLANAAKRYDRVVQCGTQSRSHKAVQEAVKYVRSGELGRIQYVIGTCYKPRRPIGKLDHPLAVPESVDYDLWCGPAKKAELYRNRLHYDWHWDFNTG
ncbi:MAG: Gfo/Idh/MocA family oxidoreductase, partial [Planctomycetales bacterium]|nr:Gfo/Idh/MocA family oxidoreductase [Planctomycetales bacterium]